MNVNILSVLEEFPPFYCMECAIKVNGKSREKNQDENERIFWTQMKHKNKYYTRMKID